MTARGALPVRFVRGESRRYRSVMRRADGLEVELEGGSYNRVGGPAGEVPHDVAHLIVEDELGLTGGVWGVLGAGGMVGHARVVAGRRAPHAGRRGREAVAEARESVMQAEMLTRALCDACAGALPADAGALRRAVGERWWSEGFTAAALARCRARLHEAGERWARLAPGKRSRPPGRTRGRSAGGGGRRAGVKPAPPGNHHRRVARAPSRPWLSRDRALAARAVLALGGVALASGLVVAALALLDLRALWVLAAAAGLAAVQLLAGARLALTVAGARAVSREDEPALHAALERLCQLADLAKPRLAIAETPAPLAFAVRRPGDAGVVCLARGLVDELPLEELEAVMAHELAHLAHRDAMVMTVASSMAALAGLMLRFYWWSGFPEDDADPRRPLAWRVGRSVLWVLSPAIALAMMILRIVAVVPGAAVALVAALTLPPAAALSRARELVADREAVLLTGRPATLASALTRIDEAMPAIPARDIRRVSAVRALLILPADPEGAWAWGLLRSHPPTAERVASLLELQRRLDAVPVG